MGLFDFLKAKTSQNAEEKTQSQLIQVSADR